MCHSVKVTIVQLNYFSCADLVLSMMGVIGILVQRSLDSLGTSQHPELIGCSQFPAEV